MTKRLSMAKKNASYTVEQKLVTLGAETTANVGYVEKTACIKGVLQKKKLSI